jgi:hypothetical protein
VRAALKRIKVSPRAEMLHNLEDNLILRFNGFAAPPPRFSTITISAAAARTVNAGVEYRNALSGSELMYYNCAPQRTTRVQAGLLGLPYGQPGTKLY